MQFQNVFHGEDEYHKNKSFLGHLGVSNYKISSTMVKMKSTKISRSGASESIRTHNFFTHGEREDTEKHSTLAPVADFATSSFNHLRMRRSLFCLARFYSSFAPLLQIFAR